MPPDLSKHLARAKQAIDRRNWDQALLICEECQDVDPANLDVYRLHAEAAKKKAKEAGKTSMFNVGMPTLTKDPHKQLSAALKRLGKVPNLKNFAEASECAAKVYKTGAKAMVDVAILLLEEAKATGLFDQQVLWNLSYLYHDKFKDGNSQDNDLLEKALRTMVELERAVTNHPEAGRTIKNWEAERSLLNRNKGSGGAKSPAASTDYRSQLSSEDKARRQEAMNRIIRTEQEAAEVLGYIEQDLAVTPGDKSLWMKKADIHQRQNQFELARRALEEVQKLDSHDFQVIIRLGDVRSAELNAKIQAAKAAGQDDTALKQELLVHEIADYRRRVERQPTDMNHRYNLAMRLFRAGDIEGAAAELQKSVSDPKLKRPSFRLLGYCMEKKGLLDLAIKQYTGYLDLAEDDMTDQAKEVRYQRARLNEAMGRKDNARNDYSRLVEIDLGYKDAAKRLSDIDAGTAQAG